MRYLCFGYHLPHFISARLFGDRKKFGLTIQSDDPDWIAWQKLYINFYKDTQKKSIGKIVNDAGYRILTNIKLQDLSVMEFGPGILPHYEFWNGKPIDYLIIDNQKELLNQSKEILEQQKIPVKEFLSNSYNIPVLDQTVDIVLSFYSLEHLYPLDNYLLEMKRVLKPGGLFVGAIPAEGGLAWGFGRFLTSRRYIRKHSTINPDKIICWEHPNFAESILTKLDSHFKQIHLDYWPFWIRSIDLNLVISFVYQKI